MATILIIDDRPVNRELLVTLLSYDGHRMLEAADGAEGLRVAHAEHPDLVITDIVMPTMDGYGFTQRLRAEPEFAGTPIIFYTAAYRMREAEAVARTCGVLHVLAKPCDPAVILRTVQQILRLPERPASPATPPGEPGPLIAGEVDRQHLGRIGNQVAEYLSHLDVINHRIAGLVDLGQELTDVPGAMRQLSTRLSATLGDLQTVSLRLTALLEMGLDLAVQQDSTRMLEIGCRSAREILGARYAALAILGEDGRSLRHFLVSGMDDPERDRLHAALVSALDEGRSPVGDYPMRARGLGGDAQAMRLPGCHPPIESFLGLPFVTLQGRKGWFYFADKLGAVEFSEDDERIAMTLASQVAVSYGNAASHEEQLQQAQAEAHGKAEGILLFLSARGIPVSDDLRSRILACRDLALLDCWIWRAAMARTAEAVVAE